MLKRARWFAVGVCAGAGTTMYSYVRWRESRSRLSPDQLSETMVGAARSAGRRARASGERARATAERARATAESVSEAVRQAMTEGRHAMAEAEARIQADLDRPGAAPRTRPDA